MAEKKGEEDDYNFDFATACQTVKSKKARFAVFKILSGSKIYVDCVGTRQNTWKDFKKLCKRQPFFAVYDYEYKTKDGRATDKFFCIYYKPQETNQQDCVIYSQKLNSFRTSLSGADNKDLEDADEVEELLKEEVVDPNRLK